MADQEEVTTEQTQSQTSQAARAAAPEREAPIEQIRQLKARIETLEKELTQEREKATDYMNRAMRTQAEMSNMRKRMQQEMNFMLKDTVKSVVYEQLAVLDSFDRAFSTLPPEFKHFSWVNGIGLIQNQLFSVLFRTGVTPIETQGKKFDPIEHEAVAYEETSTYPEETVTAELQRGYKLQDAVLRPALVKIARAPQPVAAGNVGSEGNSTEATTESQAQSEIHSATTTDQ
ncbi:MAG TPA: nucleotide exchange factor GrpE [Ktedonobacteraceae bacterium]|nr:nucleotide exchange factor GrpE [Ktedonobacteraceae bacterium]